jgi:hypothetical protein
MNETLIEKDIFAPPVPLANIAAVCDEGKAQLPDHLVQLPGGQWGLWRWFGVRGTGFPVEQVLKLAVPECALAADRLLEAQGQVERVQQETLDALRRDLTGADAARRAALLTAIQTLKKAKLPKSLNFEGAGQRALDDFRSLRTGLDAARSDFEQQYGAATDKVSQSILDVIRQERFRCAVTWQNRQAIHTSINPLLRKPQIPAARGSKQRQHEEMVASYLQRYCVKNDTIGFFGPMGWGRFSTEGPTIEAAPGQSLLAMRHVRFEAWCIDTVAAKLAEKKSLRPWMTPRRLPHIRVEGTTLYPGNGQASKISPKLAVVLHACNGQRTAQQIAVGLTKVPKISFRTEEVYALLEELQSQSFISWTLEIPADLHPEQYLRVLLERIEEVGLREECLALLNELDGARHNVSRSADDPLKLDQALAELEAVFTRITGQAPTRNHGQTYAGRTLVYEDCRRDIEIHIGPDFLNTLGPTLSLLLTSARWLTFEAGKLYRKAFLEMYRQLVKKSGSTVVEALAFVLSLNALFNASDDGYAMVETILSDFHRRWSSLLVLPAGERRVEFSCAELRERVMELFDAPHPGWASGLYHSPDLMVITDGEEATRRGDYRLVMGELHIAANTLKNSCFVAQHQDPNELIRMYDADLPEPRLHPISSKPFIHSRVFPMMHSDKGFRLLCTNDAYSSPEQKTLPISSMVVEEVAGELVLRTRDGQHSFEILEACASIVVSQVIQRFNLMGTQAYNPRISFDRVVVCREAWRFSPSEMAFAGEKKESKRFLGARSWMRAHGLPRFVFVKVPVEVKPFYVDLESPIYIDILAKMVRRTIENGEPDALVNVTEMLPQAQQTWLYDAEGQRYTSEIRCIAVDPTMRRTSF